MTAVDHNDRNLKTCGKTWCQTVLILLSLCRQADNNAQTQGATRPTEKNMGTQSPSGGSAPAQTRRHSSVESGQRHAHDETVTKTRATSVGSNKRDVSGLQGAARHRRSSGRSERNITKATSNQSTVI